MVFGINLAFGNKTAVAAAHNHKKKGGTHEPDYKERLAEVKARTPSPVVAQGSQKKGMSPEFTLYQPYESHDAKILGDKRSGLVWVSGKDRFGEIHEGFINKKQAENFYSWFTKVDSQGADQFVASRKDETPKAPSKNTPTNVYDNKPGSKHIKVAKKNKDPQPANGTAKKDSERKAGSNEEVRGDGTIPAGDYKTTSHNPKLGKVDKAVFNEVAPYRDISELNLTYNGNSLGKVRVYVPENDPAIGTITISTGSKDRETVKKRLDDVTDYAVTHELGTRLGPVFIDGKQSYIFIK